jgi:hypothetical protein
MAWSFSPPRRNEACEEPTADAGSSAGQAPAPWSSFCFRVYFLLLSPTACSNGMSQRHVGGGYPILLMISTGQVVTALAWTCMSLLRCSSLHACILTEEQSQRYLSSRPALGILVPLSSRLRISVHPPRTLVQVVGMSRAVGRLGCDACVIMAQGSTAGQRGTYYCRARKPLRGAMHVRPAAVG